MQFLDHCAPQMHLHLPFLQQQLVQCAGAQAWTVQGLQGSRLHAALLQLKTAAGYCCCCCCILQLSAGSAAPMPLQGMEHGKRNIEPWANTHVPCMSIVQVLAARL
jgi:hypothetical protein